MLVGRLGRESFQVQGRIVLGTLEEVVVGNEKAVASLWTNRVLEGALPDHAGHAFPAVVVRQERTKALDAPRTEQDAAGALDERDVLGVEEAEGIRLAQVGRKSIEQRPLIACLMDPSGVIPELGLARRVDVQVVEIPVVLDVLTHHPAERDDTGRVGGIALARRREVPVVRWIHRCQFVPLDVLGLERCHEGRPLIDATGPLLRGQNLQRLSCHGLLVDLALGARYALELGASPIELRSLADDPRPPGVMPRDADR